MKSRTAPLHDDRCLLLKWRNNKKKKSRVASVPAPDSFPQTHKSKAKDFPSTSLHHHHYSSSATTTAAAATASTTTTTTTASMINLFILPVHALTHSSGRRPSPSQHRLFLPGCFFFSSPSSSPFFLPALQVSGTFCEGLAKDRSGLV